MSKQKVMSATKTLPAMIVEAVQVEEVDTTWQRCREVFEASIIQQPCRKHGGVSFEEAVKVRAYQLWERAGRPVGDGTPFWLEAESELRAFQ
jgi:hypothetical protein